MLKEKRNWDIFFSSVFFVLGFSLIFSLGGVLLQSILSNVAYTVQTWLGRNGGIIIILFGLFLLGLITPKFLQKVCPIVAVSSLPPCYSILGSDKLDEE